MFVATKIVSEPELAGQQEVVPLLSHLAELDASLQDGKFGRPILGFLHPTIAETIIDLQYEFERNPVLSSWDDWATEFRLLQRQFQRLIELFPNRTSSINHLCFHSSWTRPNHRNHR